MIIHQQYLDSVLPLQGLFLGNKGTITSTLVPLPRADPRLRVPPNIDARSFMDASPVPLGRASSSLGSNPRPSSSMSTLTLFSVISTSTVIVSACECVTTFLIPSRI